MLKSITHLTGTAVEWMAHDIVIPKGEIAIEVGTFGRYRMKIGNGSDPFSVLPYAWGNYATFDSQIALKNGFSYRTEGATAALTISTPYVADLDFFCDFCFLSGDDPTEFSVQAGNIYFTGDGTADGEFIPDANTRYSVFVWYDNGYQGVIRGVPNA